MASNTTRADLSVQLDPAMRKLTGDMRFVLPEDFNTSPLICRLAPEATVETVTLNDRDADFSFEQGSLSINMSSARVGTRVKILYQAKFDDPVPQEIVGIEDPTYGVEATILPEGAFLAASSAWHPQLPLVDEWGIRIIAPKGMLGITDGRLANVLSEEDRTITTWETSVPTGQLTLAAGFYEMNEEQVGGIQLLTFFTRPNAALASRYLEACREYLTLYQELLGPYPYTKFAVVENFFPTGYGLPGWTLLGSRVVRLPFILTSSLPHEIVHAWWGNAVEVDYGSGNWCEGLATYLADYLLKERSDPDEALEYRLKLLRDYATLVDDIDDFPLHDFRRRTNKSNQAIGYGKAAMVFHMLRKEIGEDAFWRGLNSAATGELWQRVSWRDLQRHFEVTSGRDLSRFFDQWIERPGAAKLTLADVVVKEADDGWKTSGVLRQQPPFYELSIDLALTHVQGQNIRKIAVTGAETGFSVRSRYRPLQLVADPQSDLFRHLEPSELPVTVNALRAAKHPLVVIAENVSPAVIEASADLLRGLHWQKADVVAEADLTPEQLATDDLLYLGWPNDPRFPGKIPGGLSVDKQGFTVGGKIFKKPNDVLFVTLDKTGRGRGSIGILHALSPEAAKQVARKIPHYGRYSYLAFSSGQNRVKGTWPPENSPLNVTLSQ